MLDRLFTKESGSGDHQPRKMAVLDPLLPEWDLLVEIHASLRCLPGVAVVYVKGHQDTGQAVEQLPLMAQLNVEADTRANLYQTQFGSHRSQVLMSNCAGAHLATSVGTITAKYKEVLLEKSTSPEIRQYVQETITGQMQQWK
jgi:hypothetical protein